MIWLCLVSCGGGRPEAGPTADATQRWLGTKCPPQEACAPEQGPEEIAQDYLEALIVGNCDQAAGYWLPERKDRAKEHCVSGLLLPGKQSDGCQMIEFSRDEISIEQLAKGISFRISGKYTFECDQETEDYELNDLILFFEEREGEWYVAGYEN